MFIHNIKLVLKSIVLFKSNITLSISVQHIFNRYKLHVYVHVSHITCTSYRIKPHFIDTL